MEPFTAKDGREMLKIVIPNADRSDHTPWASFVLPAKAVHENQYGKGLWAKVPADGSDANDDCDQLHDSSGENFLRQPDTVLATAFWKTRSEGSCFPVPEPS